MFSNGKFKNTIAAFEESEKLPVAAGQTHESRIPLSLMENGGGRHWVALEDRYGRYKLKKENLLPSVMSSTSGLFILSGTTLFSLRHCFNIG
jgi:hypothetical protein